MNTRKLVLFCITLLFCSSIFGITVETSTARLVATNWYRHYAPSEKKLGSISKTAEYKHKDATNFYIFTFDKGGFVMVSTNNLAEPILGYDFESSVPDSINNPAVKGMFDGYAHQIDTLSHLNLKSASINPKWEQLINNTFLKSGTASVVTPLLTTTWNQGWPYNALCPVDPAGPGGHVWAGCTATAMAQILKYHNYPNQGVGTYSYQSGAYPISSANFGATTYNWANMPNKITSVNNDMATLIYQAAVSLRSTWGSGSTSANATDATNAFVNYFGYAFSSIKYEQSSNYTSEQWSTLLQTELTNNRPVFYRGDGAGGGHAWVCDGVDASNLYHFNWGWGGSYNGYFALTALSPGTHSYSNNQAAVIGIKPNDGSTMVNNATWSGNVSISNTIMIPAGITLTVEPGTVVKFAQNCKLQVSGKILSVGTSSKPITFTAADTTNGWWGIKLYGNGMENIDTTRFVYSQIQYSKMTGVSIQDFTKVKITHCKVNNNGGGGVSVSGASIVITDSKFYKNYTTGSGGGLYVNSNDNLMTIIRGNEIFQNSASNGGGGACLSNTAIFSENLVHHNQANYGAGAYLSGSTAISQLSVVSNKFCNNTAITHGGGLDIENCNPKIISNLIANNLSGSSTKGYGGGIICASISSPQITNNTIVNNRSYQGGAICVANYDGLVSLKNCIVYGNTSVNTGNQIMLVKFSNFSPVFDHCTIQGGLSAFGGSAVANYNTNNYTNNLDINPLFISPSAGAGIGFDGLSADWSLQTKSPCINVGDVTGIANLIPALDLAGKRRINGIIDMGAYESSVSTNTNNALGEASKSVKAYPNPVVNELIIEFTGNTQNTDFEVINSLGQVVSSGVMFEKTVVSTASFTPGIYLIKLKLGETVEFKKFLKN